MAKKRRKKKSESNFINIGQYKVSKNKKTKYIELGCGKNAPKDVKRLIKKLEELMGTNVLFVNLFDPDFKEEYDIPDFVKGSISINPDSDRDEDDEDDDEDDNEEDEEETPKKRKKKKSKKKTRRKKSSDEDEDDDEDDDEIPY